MFEKQPTSPSRALALAQQQWDQGDWETLILWDRPELSAHPQRKMIALMCARAYLHLEDFKNLRLMTLASKNFGASADEISQFIFANKRILFINEPETAEADQSSIKNSGTEIDNSMKAEIQQLKFSTLSPYGHNRKITPENNRNLKEFSINKLTQKQIKSAYIDYLGVKSNQSEKNCIGRLATTVQDMTLRQLVVDSIGSENPICILEIGALYGISLAILYNHACTKFPSAKIVCLDPFDGYYGQALDALLNQPVNEKTFYRNMEILGVPKSDYRVIKKYSTEPEAIKEASALTFDLLIIDGDHSFEGVKFDFENYFPFVRKGGFVILDDYNAKEWPGVQKFVDEELQKINDFEYLGFCSRTAVGRKI